MTFDEILENLQAQDPKALLYDALDELEKSVVVAATAADKASKAYYADATAKAEKISARVGLLRKQHSEFQKKIEALKKPLLEVTVSGNTQKLADLKASMKALEADKLQVSTELEMLESAHMSGADELYNDVVQKNDHYLSVREAYQEAKRKAYEFAIKREEIYHTIQRETQYYNAIPMHGPNMKDLEEHYHFEKWEQIHAEDAKQRAALEAEEANRPRNIETFSARIDY